MAGVSAMLALLCSLAVSFALVEAELIEHYPCDDNYVFVQGDHFWAHKEESGLWRKNLDCRWQSKPEIIKQTDYKMKAADTRRCPERNEKGEFGQSCRMVIDTYVEKGLDNHFGIEMNQRATITNRLDQLAGAILPKNRRVADAVTRRDRITCDVKPGYEVDVFMLPESLIFKGTLQSIIKEWDGCCVVRSGSQHCYELRGEFALPIIDTDNGNQIVGTHVCETRPFSSTTEIYFYKNDRQLAYDCEYPGVSNLLSRMANNVPQQGQSVPTQVTECGVKIYGLAKCFNLDNLDTAAYKRECQACIQYATDNILARGNSAYGANWRINNCFVRYEFYNFN